MRLKLPVIGRHIGKAADARFCRKLARATRSGVPQVPSRELAAREVPDLSPEQRNLQMPCEVVRGDSFTRVVTSAGFITQ